MTNELMAATVHTIGALVSAIATNHRESSTIRKAELAELKDRLLAAHLIARANRLGSIYISNLQQLILLQRFIDENPFSDKTLRFAFNQMESLSSKLVRLVDQYEQI